MHPQKNRCITFWAGWKYSPKSSNYCTPRHSWNCCFQRISSKSEVVLLFKKGRTFINPQQSHFRNDLPQKLMLSHNCLEVQFMIQLEHCMFCCFEFTRKLEYQRKLVVSMSGLWCTSAGEWVLNRSFFLLGLLWDQIKIYQFNWITYDEYCKVLTKLLSLEQ